MVRTETIIAVKNVPQSSEFYQKLLRCKSKHGGDTFEILTDESIVILCLHKWGEHDHRTMIKPRNSRHNGLMLFLRGDNLNKAYKNAKTLNANIEKEIHYNKKALNNQLRLRDLDNYYLIIPE